MRTALLTLVLTVSGAITRCEGDHTPFDSDKENTVNVIMVSDDGWTERCLHLGGTPTLTDIGPQCFDIDF